MKKLLSIALVFVFCYSIVGFYLNFEIEQFRIREETREKIMRTLPETELALVKISSAEKQNISWMDGGREFRYKGNMYDVVRIKKGTNSTWYYCFSDVKESRLLAHLDKLVKEQTGNSQSRTHQKKQEITYFFQESCPPQCLTETPILFFNYPARYKSIDTDVLSPPPRITA